MAISVTSDLTEVTSCDTTTTLGTFYRLNGVNSGNPAAEADAKIQGVACIAFKEGTSVSPTDTGGHFNRTSTIDLTGKHIFHWRNSVTPANMSAKASQGVVLGITTQSNTGTSAWATANYKRWNLTGGDIDVKGGWVCYVVDPSSAGDNSNGTVDLTLVKNFAFINRQATSVNTALNNALVDAVRAGTGLTATASSAGDTITLASVFAVDTTNTNAWGILTQSNGIYYAAGKMTFGATGQTNTCLVSIVDQVLVWQDFIVGTTFYEILGKGAASFKTTINITNSIVRSAGTPSWTLTADANTIVNISGASLGKLRAATLNSSCSITDTSIASSGTITTGAAAITNSSFSGATGTSLLCTTASAVDQIQGNTFTSPGTGHAIEFQAAGGTYSMTLSGNTFTSYAASNGSTGNEALYINVASGSVTVNISNGASPSYRTAGASVTIQNSVTLTISANVSLSGAEVRIYDLDNSPAGSHGTELSGTESNATSTYVYSGSASNLILIQVFLTGYEEYSASYTMPSVSQTYGIVLMPDTNT